MTDEEMAKDYAEHNQGLCTNEFGNLYHAFLAGAEFGYNKANEWHDLRKDPNDLPKDNDEKLCFYEKGKVVARYDSEYNCWETYFNNFETVIPLSVIIAWKEIILPKESL